MKKYLSLLLKEAQQDQKAIQYYLKYHTAFPSPSSQLLSSPEYSKLLSPYFQLTSQKFSQWMNEPYEQNTQYPEKLIHKSCSGNTVRSKSEAIIDTLLYTNKIPFRYECLLKLGTSSLYPDFTILHPQTGSLYYWEHFGLMDVPEYQVKTISKLQLYISHGIIPTLQLITTFETRNQPFTSDIAEKIIYHYFLEG